MKEMVNAFFGIGDIPASTLPPFVYFLPGLIGVAMLVGAVATGSSVVFPVGIALMVVLVLVASPSQRRLHVEGDRVEVFSWFRSRGAASADEVELEHAGRSWSWWTVEGERVSVSNRGSEALFELVGVDPTDVAGRGGSAGDGR